MEIIQETKSPQIGLPNMLHIELDFTERILNYK